VTIPDEMTALVADAAVPDPVAAVGKLRVAKIPVPQPKRGEVLVRVHAAPCNPADLLYLEGRYGIDRPLPATPGFEGAGTIVASGGGLLGRWLRGRRVAFGGHDCTGAWAEYCVAPAAACLPLARALTFEQGAAALANPATAIALTETMRKAGHRAYIQNAAAGQLGQMIFAATRRRGLPGIHIVRRADQAEAVRAAGAEHVLVSTDASFQRDLAERAKAIGATVALDAIAGEMTGQLVDALPPESEVIVYGALSGQPCGAIDPMKLAFGHKRVRGFEVAAYLREIGLLRAFRLASTAQRRVRDGEFSTAIRGRTSLADAPTALADYVRRMSDGKLLLTPVIEEVAGSSSRSAARTRSA
jgi:NADPH2:quinone reductase